MTVISKKKTGPVRRFMDHHVKLMGSFEGAR